MIEIEAAIASRWSHWHAPESSDRCRRCSRRSVDCLDSLACRGWIAVKDNPSKHLTAPRVTDDGRRRQPGVLHAVEVRAIDRAQRALSVRDADIGQRQGEHFRRDIGARSLRSGDDDCKQGGNAWRPHRLALAGSRPSCVNVSGWRRDRRTSTPRHVSRRTECLCFIHLRSRGHRFTGLLQSGTPQAQPLALSAQRKRVSSKLGGVSSARSNHGSRPRFQRRE
jgi:hypothetical protein